jgi:hypothetical protein
MILDLGPSSIKHVVSTLDRSKALLWNGRSERSRSSRSTRVLSKLGRQRPNSRGAGSCCRWPAAVTPCRPQRRRGHETFFLRLYGGWCFPRVARGKTIAWRRDPEDRHLIDAAAQALPGL